MESRRRIAVYCRVSTPDQSVESQVRAIEEYCAARQFEIVDRYVDTGFSGSARQRPELDRLMADARRRRFDVVVVFRFDRFARSTRHLLSALEDFRSLGIDFISLTEAVDTSTPIGEALFTIIGAVGQLERDAVRERVRFGMKNAKAKGKRIGRPKLRDDQEIASLRANGLSIRAIAKRLQVSPAAVQRSLANVSKGA